MLKSGGSCSEHEESDRDIEDEDDHFKPPEVIFKPQVLLRLIFLLEFQIWCVQPRPATGDWGLRSNACGADRTSAAKR